MSAATLASRRTHGYRVLVQPHLLIVDDEAPVRYLLSDFFRSRGYLATAAANATEMWRTLDSTPVHVMILDIALEDADGLVLLREIKQTHPKLPVLMLTGMGYADELENEALQRGAAGYVSKLSPLDQLLLAVRRALTTASQEADRRRAS